MIQPVIDSLQPSLSFLKRIPVPPLPGDQAQKSALFIGLSLQPGIVHSHRDKPFVHKRDHARI